MRGLNSESAGSIAPGPPCYFACATSANERNAALRLAK
jgi:hypothetical protein